VSVTDSGEAIQLGFFFAEPQLHCKGVISKKTLPRNNHAISTNQVERNLKQGYSMLLAMPLADIYLYLYE